MCIMHMSHEEVGIDALELRRLCGKNAKKQQKTAQKLKIFTKIYCTLELAMLESTPFEDFDPLESTNLFLNCPSILDAPKWKFQN